MLLTACKGKTSGEVVDPICGTGEGNAAPQLTIKGQVADSNGIPLENIKVALYGVREETERDIYAYNYALTDSLGRYYIVRYRGNNCPQEVTLVVSDLAAIYKEQTILVPVKYDSIVCNSILKPYNGFVTADFVLCKGFSE